MAWIRETLTLAGYKESINGYREDLYEMRKYPNYGEFRRNAIGAYNAYLTKYRDRIRPQLPDEYFKRQRRSSRDLQTK